MAALLRYGQLCKECKSGKCCEQMPLEIACPACNENGCSKCEERGRFEVKECPGSFIGSEVFAAIELADMYEKGMAPVAGAVLDQSKWFVELCRFFWFECRRVENALGIVK